MRTLLEIAHENQTDKVKHGYIDIYAKIFEPHRLEPLNILELGVGGGESINTWLEYFPNAKIFGIDWLPLQKQKENNNERYTFTQGSIVDKNLFNRLFYDESLHLIIDDASHHPEHQAITQLFLWPKLVHDGLYFIEDIQLAEGPCNSLDYWSLCSGLKNKIYDLRKEKNEDNILILLQK